MQYYLRRLHSCLGCYACNDIAGLQSHATNFPVVVIWWEPCQSEATPVKESIDTILSSNTETKLRGGVNTGNIGCLPNAQKVKVQHQLNAIESKQVFELEVTLSGLNVAKGKPVVSSDVAATVVERMLEQVDMDMEHVEFVFDASAEFCESTVSQVASPSESQPVQASSKWNSRRRLSKTDEMLKT
ncbi:hypothetical protein ACHAWO_001258 [Cyclotella atomus]|uniref:Uncharacterized protein n=1 Tax=Cyclotella atomus TaxID=382360 RepID=A0ABD3QLM4_9STRA